MKNDSHAADAAMLSELPQATGFVTSIFLGRGEYARHESATLCDARNVATQMAAHYQNGRKALVYAQLTSGQQFLVPDSYKEGETTMNTDTGKTFGKRFNAQRAAKSALGKDAQEGSDFTTSKNESGEWTWVAIEKVVEPVAAEPTMQSTDPDAPNYIDPDFAKEVAPRKERAAKRAARIAASPSKATRKGGIFGDDPLAPPDFSAKTHSRFRGKLAALTALVRARDIAGIRNFHVNPVSSSPKALMRYKERALAALTK